MNEYQFTSGRVSLKYQIAECKVFSPGPAVRSKRRIYFT